MSKTTITSDSTLPAPPEQPLVQTGAKSDAIERAKISAADALNMVLEAGGGIVGFMGNRILTKTPPRGGAQVIDFPGTNRLVTRTLEQVALNVGRVG